MIHTHSAATSSTSNHELLKSTNETVIDIDSVQNIENVQRTVGPILRECLLVMSQR